MLADRMRRHGSAAWLINTGWSGGPYGIGERIPLRYTRAIIDAVHEGRLEECDTVEDAIFGLAVPTQVRGVPEEILAPSEASPVPASRMTRWPFTRTSTQEVLPPIFSTSGPQTG